MFSRVIRIISIAILCITTSRFAYSANIEWEVNYEGDVTPVKAPQPWSGFVAGGNKVNVTSSKELHIVDDSNAGYAYFLRNEKSFKTLTLETRVKVISNSDGSAVSLRIVDTSNVAQLFFQLKKIELRSGFAAFPESQFDIDMREYHTVRILKDGENVVIYVDGRRQIEGKIGATSSSTARISFGSLSWSGEGESYWDYIKYTTKGAFQPEKGGKQKFDSSGKFATHWGEMRREGAWKQKL